MRPFVCEIPSYIEDTQDFVNRLTDITLEEDMWLASRDVESLYSNINHNLGIAARLDTRGVVFRAHTELILKHNLEHNFFLFNYKIYQQKKGNATGTACAPTYANLFLGWWERTRVFTELTCVYFCGSVSLMTCSSYGKARNNVM